jgi:serine/threonine protein kinase
MRQIVENYKSPKLVGQDEGYVVFSGRESDTRKPVWIKILPRLLGREPQIASSFRRLSQSIRQLNHPNIVPVQRVGDQGGLPYIITRAMEKAQPLADKLDQPWAVDTAADVVMQVGQALEHAYNKGIVHGSLTPQNVVVRDDGRAAVTDFGVVELLNLVGVRVKQAASPYLAPERMAGTTADARADVYSLAAILYSLLTKRSPELVRGSFYPPSRFNAEVPPEMDRIVLRALDPDPARRYPDAKAFLAALGAVTLVPVVEKARQVTPGERCSRCGARNQRGRFCRKCGARLETPEPAVRAPVPPPARSRLDEPIQITKIDVGRIEVGKGVEIRETVIAKPRTVATTELAAEFPEPLEMPQVRPQDLWPEVDGKSMIAMPEPPPMPVIDWAEVAPPMPQVPSMEDLSADEEGD